MYGRQQKNSSQPSEKNPNRVAGGLRAQGVDTFEMLGEDGSIQKIPTQAYVQSLEEQIRKHKGVINTLERKSSKLEQSLRALEVTVHNLRK